MPYILQQDPLTRSSTASGTPERSIELLLADYTHVARVPEGLVAAALIEVGTALGQPEEDFQAVTLSDEDGEAILSILKEYLSALDDQVELDSEREKRGPFTPPEVRAEQDQALSAVNDIIVATPKRLRDLIIPKPESGPAPLDTMDRILRGLDHWAVNADDPAIRADCAAGRDAIKRLLIQSAGRVDAERLTQANEALREAEAPSSLPDSSDSEQEDMYQRTMVRYSFLGARGRPFLTFTPGRVHLAAILFKDRIARKLGRG